MSWIDEPIDESPMMEYIRSAVAATMKPQHEAIERACEIALQTGVCGVIVDYPRGYARPDPRVPYGWIYDVSACGEDGVIDWSRRSDTPTPD